jgi:hypothetical protein
MGCSKAAIYLYHRLIFVKFCLLSYDVDTIAAFVSSLCKPSDEMRARARLIGPGPSKCDTPPLIGG